MGRLHLVFLIALAVPGCIASNVVAETDRAVATDPLALPWRAAVATDVDGLFESLSIEGEAAAGLWKIYYWFERGGAYTAAALTAGDGVHFRTIDGTWRLTDAGIVLDDGPAVPADGCDSHLRLRAPAGTLVLRRVAQR